MSADIRELLAEIERLNEELAATKAHLAEGQDFIAITDVARAEVARLRADLTRAEDTALTFREQRDASNAKCLELAERLVVADARVAHLERTFQEQSQAWALPAERAEKRVAELESKGRKDAAVIADFMAGSQSAIDECDRKGALVQTLRAERDAALARIAELQVTAGALTDRVTELEQAAELNHDKRLMIISRAETAEAERDEVARNLSIARREMAIALDRATEAGAENRRLREALEEVRRDCACSCSTSYTRRGQHGPNSFCYLVDVAKAALALAAQPTESLRLYGVPPVEASRLTGVLRADPREVVPAESPSPQSTVCGTCRGDGELWARDHGPCPACSPQSAESEKP
jgi:chromosome segregation ATPase